MSEPDGTVFEMAQLATSAGQADLLEQRLTSAVAIFREGKARSVRMLRGVEHPERFHLIIEWPSVQVHRDFRETPLRTQWRALIDDVVTEGPSGSHFCVVAESVDH